MKKALLIGIDYINTDYQLAGCINDVTDINTTLISKYGYMQNNITILTDNTTIQPTKINILNALNNLINNSLPTDILCFYYSGHGTQIRDTTGHEISNFNDALYTLDAQLILDYDILTILTNLKGASLSMFFDCCHSGTICDLPCNIRYNGSNINNKSLFTIWTENSKNIIGNVFMFAGCLDVQTSSDSLFPKTNNQCCDNGAFTYSLLTILNNNTSLNITNRTLLLTLYNKLNTLGFSQIPQFSCNNIKSLDNIFNI